MRRDTKAAFVAHEEFSHKGQEKTLLFYVAEQ
jgi:hypothetical protein